MAQRSDGDASFSCSLINLHDDIAKKSLIHFIAAAHHFRNS
jgi:hypothetical protein